jgi:arylformamidase
MKTRKIYDVSMPIYSGMLTYTGNPETKIETFKSIATGATSNISLLHIGTHAGTHVDAPRHFIEGRQGVDAIDPEVLIGPARLFQLPDVRHIDRRVLEELDLKGVIRLLLGTRNSALLKQGFTTDYAFVSEDAASYIVELGVKLVGLDWLAVEEFQKPGRPTHHTLLGANVVIIEGLDLSSVPEGDYELLCLPLKIKDGDGAPARVLLREL